MGVQCPTCDRDDFKNESGMKAHYTQVHGETYQEYMYRNGVGVKCPTCGEICASETAVKIHHKRKHDVSIAGVELECEWCMDSFKVQPKEKDTARFCSKDCEREWKSERWRGEKNPRWKGGPVTVECAVCGEEKEQCRAVANMSERHFCSYDCMGERRSEVYSGEGSPIWSGGRIGYGSGWNDRKKRKVRIRDQARCQDCGRTEPEHLEEFGRKHTVHHIQKARNIDDPEECNAMENLVTLCTGKCHHKWEQMSPLQPMAD